VAYSAYGTVTSLNGEPEDSIVVEAIGQDKCSHFQEESISESNGQFRVRGLQPEVNIIAKCVVKKMMHFINCNSLEPSGHYMCHPASHLYSCSSVVQVTVWCPPSVWYLCRHWYT
jgi:hypothetical protein